MNMKNAFFYLLLIAAVAGFYFYNHPRADFTADKKDGIQFRRDNWNEALQLAKKENKPIFLDIYATWCGPCKKMKQYSFSDKEVGQYYNQHFINVSLNGEQGDGNWVSSQYKVGSYPTLLFIDPAGNIISQHTGYQSSGELLRIGAATPR
jgi:thioredoxin 1